jgi:predicted RNA-binding Zn ribbon-like protein
MSRQIGYNRHRVSTEQRPQEFQFDLSGGHLALDFANTISRRDSPEATREHLHTYHDLVAFSRQSQVITQEDASVLRQKAESQPRQAAQMLRLAITLREAIFAAFLALAHKKQPSPQDIALIDKAASSALQHRRIVRVNGNYEWQWDAEPLLERILWPIAESAAELLTSADITKVRECEASDCYWLFLDNSRNRSRRWCTMSACGNREKARRHYRKQRGT